MRYGNYVVYVHFTYLQGIRKVQRICRYIIKKNGVKYSIDSILILRMTNVIVVSI